MDAAPRDARLDGVEGVRAVAAVSVLVFHVWRYGSPGSPVELGAAAPLARLLPAGVVLFFALSGFLLYRPYASALTAGTALPAWRPYAWRRAARILPAYWVVLVATGLGLGAAVVGTSPAGGLQIGSLASRPAVLAADAALLQNLAPAWVYTGIGPAWSLHVEAVFYVVLPVLAAAAAASRVRRPQAALLVPLALLLVGTSTKVATMAAGEHLGRWHEVALVSFAYHADLFAPGMLLAVVAARGAVPVWPRWRAAAIAAAAALVTLALALAEAGALPQPAFETAVAIAATLALAVVVIAPSGGGHRLRRFLSSPSAHAAGLASYSLYLWHEPLIHVAARYGWTVDGPLGVAVNVALIGTVAGVLAAATYALVEAPLLARARARRPSPADAAPGAIS